MKLIAIDTCVFEHLLNPQWNGDSHIDQLLCHLQKVEACLCTDSNGRIPSEYDRILRPILQNRQDEGIIRYLLSYWLLYCPRNEIPVDEQDLRMARIRAVIYEHEPEDRAFVYVACAADCKLVTNDEGHILSRRGELRKDTKKLRGDNSDFISSRTAIAQLANLFPPPSP